MRRILPSVLSVAALVVAIATPAGAVSPALPAPSAPTPSTPAAEDDAGNRASGAVQPDGTPAGTTGFLPPVPSADLPADWSLLGPAGGDAYAVAASPVDPDLVLAGTAPSSGAGGSLYRSTDHAASWTRVPSLTGTSVYDIEFTPTGDVYAATIDGVHASTDGGASWTELALGIGLNQAAFDLAVDPADPAVLWAGIGDALGGQPANLIRSTDGGATWQDRTPPLPAPMGGTSIAIDPTDSNTVIAAFAGSFGGGAVWVTTDGGASWANRWLANPQNPVEAVAYDGTRLLAGGGQLFQSQFIGVYSSTDLGLTWTQLHDSSWPIPAIDAIAVDPADPDTILVASDANGVHRSTDGGDNWQIGVGGTGALATRALAFFPGSSTELLLGAGSLAVFRSTDGGDTFAQTATGITELAVTSVAANPQDADELAVSFVGQNNGGVLTSPDGGGTWNLEAVPPTRYNAVEFAPEGTLYAISDGPSSIAQEGLYRRDAGGWVLLGPDQGTLFESRLTVVGFSEADPNLIMMAGSDFGVAGNEGTIWRSADAGETWTKVYERTANGPVLDLNLAADGTGQTMQAVWHTLSGPIGSVLRSTDGGQTWSDSGTGLPGNLRDLRMCASPSDPETIYLSAWPSTSSGALYRSTDGGQSWQPTGWTGSRIVDVACDPVDDQVLYLSQSGTGATAAMRSADQGVTFQGYATGLPAGLPTGNLAFAGGGLELVLASRQGSYLTALRDTLPEPAIEVTPGSVSAEQPPGEVTEHPLTIANLGDGLLSWSITEAGDACGGQAEIPWLAVAPERGGTPAGGSNEVSLTVDSTGLASGEHTAVLCVASNDPAQPVTTVPVSVTVLTAGGCDETTTGVHAGPLTVTDGVTCLAAGARVLGEVNVTAGAGLVATAAVIQGPVSAVGPAVLALRYSQVTGPVLVLGATEQVALFASQVTGSVSVLNASTGDAAATVAGNTVIGSLTCFGNQPAPTDHGLPNTATAGKLGQCADL